MNKNGAGFTMLELIIVIGVILVISAFVMPRLLNSIAFGGDQTKEDAQEVVHLFALAQSRAAGNSGNDHWGIRLVDDGTTDCDTTTAKDCAVLYKGKSFSGRDKSYDQIFVLRNNNYWSTLADIDFYFGRKTGFVRGLYGLPHDPVAYWPLTSSTTVDISGRGQDGTLAGWWEAYIKNGCSQDSGCFEFTATGTGGGGNIDIPDVLGNQNTTGFTMSAWVNFLDQSDKYFIICGAPATWYGRCGSGGMWVDFGTVYATVFTSVDYCDLAATRLTSANAWHMITTAYDASADTLNLYVDGASAANQKTCTGVDNNSTIAYIGRNVHGDNAWSFRGKIDDVLVYDRPLSASEIAGLFNTTRPTSTTGAERVAAKVYVANGFATSTVYLYASGHVQVIDDKN